MTAYLLGIDIGTSACKAAVFRPDGGVEAQASVGYPLRHPQAGWAEQSPAEWWEAVCAAVRAALEQGGIAPAQIAGVGVDGQSWSAIPLDRDGNVLCDTPIWMDTRAQDICAELDRSIGQQRLFELCGNPLQPAYTTPKILWYQKHRPEMFKKIDKILQSNSYIVYRMCGEITQDISQGYGFHCFDMRTGRWDDAVCAEMGIPRGLLPELADCHQVVGRVIRQAALQCGLAEGTPVVAGGLDVAAGTLGTGIAAEGETQEHGGTSGGMSICLREYCADPRLILCRHVVPGFWLLQGGTVGGASVMKWMEQEFGAAERQSAAEKGTTSFAELDRLAAEIPPGAEGAVFLPYMAGERSPIWNPNAKAVWYGIDFTKTRAHLIRAGMEGVAYSLRHNLEAAAKAGARVTRMRSIGGAANSRLWTQMKSDVTGIPADVTSSDLATALGAAMLAGVGTGVYKSFGDAAAQAVRITRSHEPEQGMRAAYDMAYEAYRALYEHLEPLMRK